MAKLLPRVRCYQANPKGVLCHLDLTHQRTKNHRQLECDTSLNPTRQTRGQGGRSLTGGDPRLWHWTGEALLGVLGFASMLIYTATKGGCNHSGPTRSKSQTLVPVLRRLRFFFSDFRALSFRNSIVSFISSNRSRLNFEIAVSSAPRSRRKATKSSLLC
jgi:hypothetical protein